MEALTKEKSKAEGISMMSMSKKAFSMTNADGHLSFRTKFSYGLSEIGLQFSWTLVSSYLTVFYTDVVGLAPAVISIIMLIARIWDGVNDPMMGMIADNTKSRWGRYRPYLLFGAPILAVSNILCFSAFDFPMGGKIAYAAITYIVLGMVYTALCISQGSLSNVMTRDNEDRVQLNTFRGVAAAVASLALSSITMPLILHFGDGDTSIARGYTAAAAILSIVAVPCIWIAFANTREVITVTKEKKQSPFKDLKAVLSDRNFLLEIIYTIITMTAMFGRYGIMMYYYIYVMGRTDLVAALSVVMSLCQIISQFFIPWLTSKFDKKICLLIANLGMGLGCGLIFAAGLGTDRLILVFIGTGMLGFFNILSPLLYSLTAELVDDLQIRTGVRADGVGYSFFSFSTKIGNAIGGSIGVLCLSAVGWVANTTPSAATQIAMSGVINLAPMALYLVALIPLLLITMTNKKGKENSGKLSKMGALETNGSTEA